jgi:hypothetical protein
MKRVLLLGVSLLTLTIVSYTQAKNSVLKEVLKLEIAGEGGSNGAAVAWHPIQKKYYAAMAGNISYPLGVYDIKGKRLSPDDQSTQFDIRGLWYNPATKTLQANGYDDNGWIEYILDKKGFPETVTDLIDGNNQPTEQSVGALNPLKKDIYFFNEDGNISVYGSIDAAVKDEIKLTLGVTAGDDDGLRDNLDVIDNYNASTLIYTGIKGAEIGLLNYEENQIELYNIATSYLTRTLTLPTGAAAYDNLNFSYANGLFWLFNKETRVWTGYK